MERIAKLATNFTNSDESPVIDSAITKEIDRMIVQGKKIQSFEDQKRVFLEYRNQADINPEELCKHVFGEFYHSRREIDDYISKDLDFSEFKEYTCSREEARLKVNRLLIKISQKFPMDYESFRDDYWKSFSTFLHLSVYNGGLATKFSVHYFLYVRTILILGTEKHKHWIERGLKLQDFGCFALTEMAHGSNVQGCLTKATYDMEYDEFIINTPIERGMKFWIGNAAHTANMCVVFANMIIHGKDYGIHIFLCPIRDSNTNCTLPGVVIGDCGDKLGHKGIDNGHIMFRNVRVPRDNLLD